jgi:CHASE3 domain sensor protein
MDGGARSIEERRRAVRNVRTALILGTIALAFGVGFVLRMWLTT